MIINLLDKVGSWICTKFSNFIIHKSKIDGKTDDLGIKITTTDEP